MFKLSSDHLANFRSIGVLLETFKGWINELRLRIGNTEDRLDVLESTSGSSVAASSPGSANSETATVDFGASFTHYASASVSATWVTPATEITVTPLAASGEEIETVLMSFSTTVSDITNGVGFTLHVYTPIEAKGTYSFSCVGV